MFSRIFILFLLTSCSLFKGSEKISSSDTLKNLAAIKTTGEGKGRLHVKERQYLFGLESVLKHNKSWIMAVTIPLHGEEALIFNHLDREAFDDAELESFAARIDAGIRENFKDSELSGRNFLKALRRTLRFLHAQELGLPVNCGERACALGEDTFSIVQNEKTLRISTTFSGHELVTTASNLTGPFFLRTQFRVISPKSKRDLLTLELFWGE